MSDSENSEFTWTPAYEVQLMFAMIGLKPIGINQHFNMARIIEKFSAAINRSVEPHIIWNHLNTLYDMEKLDEMEPLPFPIDDKDFELPEDEFGEMIEQVKRGGSRLERLDHSQKKGSDDVKKESGKEDGSRDLVKEDENAISKNRSKLDKRTPLRRISKSDKTDSSGAEEYKERDEEKEKALGGGRTRRSVKTEEPSKEDPNDSKKNDPSSAKKPTNKKETSGDNVKRKPVNDSIDMIKSDASSKRQVNKTPVKNLKEPEKTPKRVTRASFTPSEIESAKKKRKR